MYMYMPYELYRREKYACVYMYLNWMYTNRAHPQQYTHNKELDYIHDVYIT